MRSASEARVQFEYVTTRVAPGVSVDFAVDRGSDDPINQWILTHDYPHEPPNQLFNQLIEPGARVVDVGAHIGTFALAAAAGGADVIAIEGSPDNVAHLEAAKERNRFDRLTVLHAAASESNGTLLFVPKQAWGEIVAPDDAMYEHERIELRSITLDSAVADAGWDNVDLVKVDVEGAELAVLRGAATTLASAPLLIVEINELQLRKHGTRGAEVKQLLADSGYRLYLIDRELPGDLVEIDAGDPQPDCVADIFAAKVVDRRQLGPWRPREPFNKEEVLSRFRTAASSDHHPYRAFAAVALAEACAARTWDLDAEFHELLDQLAHDDNEAVREWTAEARARLDT